MKLSETYLQETNDSDNSVERRKIKTDIYISLKGDEQSVAKSCEWALSHICSTANSSFSKGRLSGSSQIVALATSIDLPVSVGCKSKTACTIQPKEKMSDAKLCVPVSFTISGVM